MQEAEVVLALVELRDREEMDQERYLHSSPLRVTELSTQEAMEDTFLAEVHGLRYTLAKGAPMSHLLGQTV